MYESYRRSGGAVSPHVPACAVPPPPAAHCLVITYWHGDVWYLETAGFGVDLSYLQMLTGPTPSPLSLKDKKLG